MTPDDLTRLQVEAWKTTIEVQKHFNDIEWKIRGLALTVLTAVLGASAVAIHDGTEIKLFDWNLKLSGLLLIVGLFVWGLFYFVDQIWYHRLLIGSVRHAEQLEEILAKTVAGFELTKRISDESPYTVNLLFRHPQLHSRHKLQVFYGGVAFLLLVFAIVTQFGSQPSSSISTRNVPAMSVSLSVSNSQMKD